MCQEAIIRGLYQPQDLARSPLHLYTTYMSGTIYDFAQFLDWHSPFYTPTWEKFRMSQRGHRFAYRELKLNYKRDYYVQMPVRRWRPFIIPIM